MARRTSAAVRCLQPGRDALLPADRPSPYRGRASDVVEQVQDGKFPPPQSVKPGVPRPLEAICLKAMARDPEARYASADELAADVDNWLADRPVIAWREPFWTRTRRWARRNRTVVAAASAVLITGAVGLCALAAQQYRANTLLSNALAQSERSREQAEAVSNFLVGAFRSPDPAQGIDGRTVKVVDLIDRAAEELDEEFNGSMVTKGALLETLGQTYYGLGLFDRAVKWHTKARAVREATLGPDHADTLRTCSNLAESYRVAARPTEAITLQEATLERFEATLGPDHLDTLRGRAFLANALSPSRPSEAIALLQGRSRCWRASSGPTTPIRSNAAMISRWPLMWPAVLMRRSRCTRRHSRRWS